jgi:putative protease
VDEIRVDLKPAETALKGELCSIPVNDYLRRSDKVFKWVDEKEIRNLQR